MREAEKTSIRECAFQKPEVKVRYKSRCAVRVGGGGSGFDRAWIWGVWKVWLGIIRHVKSRGYHASCGTRQTASWASQFRSLYAHADTLGRRTAFDHSPDTHMVIHLKNVS